MEGKPLSEGLRQKQALLLISFPRVGRLGQKQHGHQLPCSTWMASFPPFCCQEPDKSLRELSDPMLSV